MLCTEIIVACSEKQSTKVHSVGRTRNFLMLSPVVSKVTTKIYEVNYSGVIHTSVEYFSFIMQSTGPSQWPSTLRQCFSTFVRPRHGKFFFL